MDPSELVDRTTPIPAWRPLSRKYSAFSARAIGTGS